MKCSNCQKPAEPIKVPSMLDYCAECLFDLLYNLEGLHVVRQRRWNIMQGFHDEAYQAPYHGATLTENCKHET